MLKQIKMETQLECWNAFLRVLCTNFQTAAGRIVALKRVKMEKERDGFPVTSVREISILLNFHHANIVNVEEVVISPK